MREISDVKYKKLRREKNIVPIETPQSESPVLIKRFLSLMAKQDNKTITILDRISGLFERIANKIESLHSSQLNSNNKLADDLSKKLANHMSQFNDKGAKRWRFEIHRNRLGRIQSIEAERIE